MVTVLANAEQRPRPFTVRDSVYQERLPEQNEYFHLRRSNAMKRFIIL